MSKTRITFTASDENGLSYRILVLPLEKGRITPQAGDLQQTSLQESFELRTADGRDVVRLKKGVYEIQGSPLIRVVSDVLDAP